MSVLLKAQAVIRSLHLLIAIIALAMLGWLRSQGWGQVWLNAPAGAAAYGNGALVLCIIPLVAVIVAASATLLYARCSHYTRHGKTFHVLRIVGDFVVLALLVASEIMITMTPGQYQWLYLTNNNQVADVYNQVSTGLTCLTIVLDVLFIFSLALTVTESIENRKHARRSTLPISKSANMLLSGSLQLNGSHQPSMESIGSVTRNTYGMGGV